MLQVLSEISAPVLAACCASLLYLRIVLVVPNRILFHPMTNPFLRYTALLYHRNSKCLRLPYLHMCSCKNLNAADFLQMYANV